MDKISNLLDFPSEINENETSSTFVKPLPHYEKVAMQKPSKPSETYLVTVMELVLKSAESISQTPTQAELASRAETWTELLFPVMPDEADLKPAYNQAFKDNKTSFPVNAIMIKNGYEALQEQRKQSIFENSVRNSQANASDEKQCPYCFNSGFVSIDIEGYSIPLQTNNYYRGVRECRFSECDYWQRRLGRLSK